MNPPDKLRVDKWLWCARFVKTRTLATRLCSNGTVRLNGQRLSKAHQAVRPGDVLVFPIGPRVRVVEVLACPVRRGPASEAQALYRDLAGESAQGSARGTDDGAAPA
jgi:ribosome-associated heat shock protein Hsp15